MRFVSKDDRPTEDETTGSPAGAVDPTPLGTPASPTLREQLLESHRVQTTPRGVKLRQHLAREGPPARHRPTPAPRPALPLLHPPDNNPPPRRPGPPVPPRPTATSGAPTAEGRRPLNTRRPRASAETSSTCFPTTASTR